MPSGVGLAASFEVVVVEELCELLLSEPQPEPPSARTKEQVTVIFVLRMHPPEIAFARGDVSVKSHADLRTW